MTLETCERLLAYYEETGNNEAALDMREHIAKYRSAGVAKKTSK